MSSSMSISGLISGLDTDSIIEKMMEYYSANKTSLEAEQAETENELSAWQSINSSILSVQTALEAIKDASDFQTNTCTSSDDDILTASADTDAVPGTYYITVSKLAQAHQVSSNSTYSSVNDVVGTGTVSFTFADSTKDFSITLDANNNTLTGLAKAINKADAGIDASIINTGTSDDPSYQLVLTSSDTGASSVFTVNSTLTGGTDPDLSNIVQTGQDAELKYGSGDNALTVIKSSNEIDDLISGVKLNLEEADENTTVKVKVTRDTSTVKSAIENFVSVYNSFVDGINTQLSYDADTETSGTLLGDYKLQVIQSQLTSAVSGIVSGLDSDIKSLASIGITHNTDGELEIDDSALEKALKNNLDDVTKLFSTNVESDSAYVTYVTSTSDTKATNKAWQVNITQAATQSTLTCGSAMGDTLEVDETITIGDTDIDLTAGMTIDEVINAINKYSEDTGVTVSATGSGGTGEGSYLTFKSVRYGSLSNFSVISDTSCSTTGSTGIGKTLMTPGDADGESGSGTGTEGVDVEGTINGATCTGKGRVLTCKDENNDACGLSILATSSTTMTTNITFSNGVGSKLYDLIEDMTSSTGIITTAQDSLQDKIDEYDDLIDDEEDKIEAKQESLYAKFTAMESALSELESQSSWLEAAFSSSSDD
ncbi:flagellar filament capping protein FliD [bacterium]|nr:flagellar filament capping protein FliD [bacterium]